MTLKNSDVTRRAFISAVVGGVAGAALGGHSLKDVSAAEMGGTGTSGVSLSGRTPPKPHAHAPSPLGARGSDDFYNGVAHEMALQWHASWG